MKNLTPRMWGLVFFIVFIDQALKIYIKTNFYLGEEVVVADWFILHFVENNGFAFGWEFFGSFGKLFLTLIRVVFVFFIFKWVGELILIEGYSWVVFALLLIISGAIGNIIDSVFYGVFFDYAPLFFGRVVDMFYFPLFSGTYPSWFPFLGDQPFVFFRFIFNIADSSITVGGGLLLILYPSVVSK